jgi:glycerol-3-phosphate dehydrogenase subunit B
VNFDCLIIGGGISGLSCGIACASAGLRTGIISGGMSALHFSSGSIDLYGYHTDRRIVYQPMDYIERLVIPNQHHPYSRCGMNTIRKAMQFFVSELAAEGLELYHNDDYNHFHVSTMGTVKPTYLSQRSVFNERIKDAFKQRSKIAILNFTGFRDFYPELAKENLKKNSLFSLFEIITGELTCRCSAKPPAIPTIPSMDKRGYSIRNAISRRSPMRYAPRRAARPSWECRPLSASTASPKSTSGSRTSPAR